MPETRSVFEEWKRLVGRHDVSGKAAHDTRLVAVMIASGLTEILTFDVKGFERYPGITVVDPRTF